MLQYLFKRVGQIVLTVFIVVTAVFVLLRLPGGDIAYSYAPPNPTKDQLLAIRAEFGLDKSVLEQFGLFLSELAHGNVGESFRFRQPALDVVLERLPYTVLLAAVAILITAVVAVPLGVWMARRNNTARETGINIATITAQSMPDFWIAFMLLIVFSLRLGWFPASGATSPTSIVLPAVTVAILQIALISRLVRREMLTNLGSSFVTVARARGVSNRDLVWGYSFQNSAIPVVTALGTRFASMLNGVVVVEVVFQWPGVGSLVVEALKNRDLPLIQATVLVTVLLALLVQLAVDVLYPVIDPRVRLGQAVTR